MRKRITDFHIYLLSNHCSRQTGFRGEQFLVSWTVSSIDETEKNKCINADLIIYSHNKICFLIPSHGFLYIAEIRMKIQINTVL